jgi:hypothetical protein
MYIHMVVTLMTHCIPEDSFVNQIVMNEALYVQLHDVTNGIAYLG